MPTGAFFVEIVNGYAFVRGVAAIVNVVPAVTVISFARIFRRKFVPNCKLHHMFAMDVPKIIVAL